MNSKEKVRLVAFVSWRIYLESRRKIKSQWKNSIVLPIFFGLGRWKSNKLFLRILRILIREKKCIARGPMAAELALDSGFNKVCYDGRAAVSAEIEEFNVIGDDKLAISVINAESRAVIESYFRISVSHSLVDYWVKKFGYTKSDHIIIPCTLTQGFQDSEKEKVEELRSQIGISNKDIVFVFSGGNAGWNSLERTFSIFDQRLKNNPKYKMILLTGEAEYIKDYMNKFPDQVFRFWVNHEDVKNYLALGDYGLMIRENKVTNNVASPVKFAEYLSLGLKPIISDNIKDYSDFVSKHNCGLIITENSNVEFNSLTEADRMRNTELAKTYLYKNSDQIKKNYNLLKEKMSN
ncbi:MAG: hypothetical protein KDC84_08230 [Crocinitomicaceae bacterium]|nr:hypothetical protein [Crocinitomicaceae bacterium]